MPQRFRDALHSFTVIIRWTQAPISWWKCPARPSVVQIQFLSVLAAEVLYFSIWQARKDALFRVAPGDDRAHILLTARKHWHLAGIAALTTTQVGVEFSSRLVDLFDEKAAQLMLAQGHRFLKLQERLPVCRLKFLIFRHGMARLLDLLSTALWKLDALRQVTILAKEAQRRANSRVGPGALVFLQEQFQVATGQFVGARPEIFEIPDALSVMDPIDPAQDMRLVAVPGPMASIFTNGRRPVFFPTCSSRCPRRLFRNIATLANGLETIQVLNGLQDNTFPVCFAHSLPSQCVDALTLLPCSVLLPRSATTVEFNHVHYALPKNSTRMHTRPHFPVIFPGISVYWGKCPSPEIAQRPPLGLRDKRSTTRPTITPLFRFHLAGAGRLDRQDHTRGTRYPGGRARDRESNLP